MGTVNEWAAYLEWFHDERPGITEDVLEQARDPDVGTAYDWLLAALPPRPGRVVDIACGSAPLQPRLTSADAYLGADISRAELALACRRGRGPVIRADARELPLASDAADTVVSSMGLMLMTPLADALREITRVLRPGGTLAVLLPARWPLRVSDLKPLLVLARTLHGTGAMPQHLSVRRATHELEDAGFVVISTQQRRFGFPLNSTDDAALAVSSLYTPGRPPHQLDAAMSGLSRLSGSAELPLPLSRIAARLPPR